jgi:wyosine [tRNA(Phe)-imidazoG37] synthetase (radical SAM superfamily)
MEDYMYKYIFGPVVSRRLGSSLGIDLVKMKTCSLNCAYCECGITNQLTIERREYVPVDVVIDEIAEFMNVTEKVPDFLTFSGSGEPTLNSRIGAVVDFVKNEYPNQKLALLTNATHLHLKEVQDAILDVNVVIPSIDAVSIDAFQKIANPHPEVTPELIIYGITEFKKRFKGDLIIEFFLVPGVNDSDSELKLLKDTFTKIDANAIQINHLDRPGAFDWVKPADMETLKRVEKYFEGLPIQLVKKPRYEINHPEELKRIDERILQTIKRRPSTLDDIVFAVGLSALDVRRELDRLVDEKKLTTEFGSRGYFYKIVS